MCIFLLKKDNPGDIESEKKVVYVNYTTKRMRLNSVRLSDLDFHLNSIMVHSRVRKKFFLNYFLENSKNFLNLTIIFKQMGAFCRIL